MLSQSTSKYLEDYCRLLDVRIANPPFPDPAPDLLKAYHVEILREEYFHRKFDRCDVRLIYVGYRATLATYLVDLGRFRLTLHLLNLPGKAPIENTIGEGAFGKVAVRKVVGTEFVAKIVTCQSTSDLEDVLVEVAISKLCALYEIGPDVEVRIPFDIILYDNAAQFHLELCEDVREYIRTAPSKEKALDNLERDTRQNLRVLHSLHIAHKDLKPDNMLFSKKFGKFVLCDFGVSEFVTEVIGQKSTTTCAGTPTFMGPEMLELYRDRTLRMRVDLYYNDAWSFMKSMNCIFTQFWREKAWQYRLSTVSNVREQEQGMIGELHSGMLSSSTEQQQSGNKLNNENSTGYKKQDYSVYAIPNSYEFYRLVFAATSLDEHQLHLSENLPLLDQKQMQFIFSILQQCLNRVKMQVVLQELRHLPKEENSLWEHWQRELVQAFRKNFDEHQPQAARSPPIDCRWLGNLKRLLGKNDTLEQVARKLKQQGVHFDHKSAAKALVGEVMHAIDAKLMNLMKRVVQNSQSYCLSHQVPPWDFFNALSHIPAVFLRYNSKQRLLQKILRLFQHPTESDHLFLRCLADVVSKRDTTIALLQMCGEREGLEECVWLVHLRWWLSEDSSDSLLRVCEALLQRLYMQPVSLRYLEILQIRHIQLKARQMRLELNYQAMMWHFKESLELLEHCSCEDSFSILTILGNRLVFYQQYNMPLGELRRAHVEFEQCRQFYSEVHFVEADTAVWNTYYNGVVPLTENGLSTLLIAAILKKQEQQQFIFKGLYRSALKSLLQLESLRKEEISNSISYERDPSHTLHEALLLMRVGKQCAAEQLLLSVRERVMGSHSLDIHIDYYQTKARIDMAIGRYEEAYKSCLRGIQFNSRVGRNQFSLNRSRWLLLLRAELCCLLGRPQECIELLEQEMYLYGVIPIAEAYRLLGRLSDSRSYCSYFLQSQGQLDPHDVLIAHSVMLRIAQSLCQQEQRLFHAWSIVTKTTTLGDEISCIAYSCLIRHYRPLIGDEVLSLISYARKETDPPLQRFRGKEIVEELYLDPVPSGRLPLDMFIEDFIELAEQRVRSMPAQQHSHCYLLKLRLLEAMKGKCTDQPEYKLLCVRMMIESRLHMIAAGWVTYSLEELSKVVEGMSTFPVAKSDQRGKQVLVDFARGFLKKLQKMYIPPDMPVDEFVVVAEERFRGMSVEDHWTCVQTKVRFCNDLLEGPCRTHPELKVRALRALVEACLHCFMTGETDLEGYQRLSATLESMRYFEVSPQHQADKWMLVEFSKRILLRGIEAATEHC